MKKSALLLTFAAVLCVVAQSAHAQTQPKPSQPSSDARVGTWKLNLAKSKYVPGPPPASETRTYASQGKALSVTVQSIDVKGAATSLQYVATTDGKDCPLKGSAWADSVAIKQLSPTRFEVDAKRNGTVIGVTTGEISNQGKTLTLDWSNNQPGGTLVHNTAVFDKQKS